MQNKINIREIAKLCGVSPATVSRAMNKNAPVSEETRKKIEQAIQDTGYVFQKPPLPKDREKDKDHRGVCPCSWACLFPVCPRSAPCLSSGSGGLYDYPAGEGPGDRGTGQEDGAGRHRSSERRNQQQCDREHSEDAYQYRDLRCPVLEQALPCGTCG